MIQTSSTNLKDVLMTQMTSFLDLSVHQFRSMLARHKCEHLGLNAKQHLEMSQNLDTFEQQLAQLNIQHQVERDAFMKYTTAEIKQRMRDFARKHKDMERRQQDLYKALKTSPNLKVSRIDPSSLELELLTI